MAFPFSGSNIYDEYGQLAPIRRPGSAVQDPNAAPPTPPPAPPVPPASYLPISPGVTPNYAALIQADPGVMAYNANAGRAIGSLGDQRKAAIRSLVLRYGGKLGGFKDEFGDIDQETLDAAGKNQFSLSSQLNRNYEQGVEMFKRQLAARGGLQSGETQWGLDQLEMGRGQEEYDTGQDFLRDVGLAGSTWAAGVGDIQDDLPGIIGAATDRVYATHKPSEAISADIVPGSVEVYGFPVYQTPDGKQYRADGSAFTPPAPAPVAPETYPEFETGGGTSAYRFM